MAQNYNDYVSISPKYQQIINNRFDYWEYREKFKFLVNHSHFFLDNGDYSNCFFYKSMGYRRNWKTAKEIQEWYNCEMGEEKYNYTASALMSYVKMGLMEVRKDTKPYLYSLPVDFFTTNFPQIRFRD